MGDVVEMYGRCTSRVWRGSQFYVVFTFFLFYEVSRACLVCSCHRKLLLQQQVTSTVEIMIFSACSFWSDMMLYDIRWAAGSCVVAASLAAHCFYSGVAAAS
jgi:hypothetical protein